MKYFKRKTVGTNDSKKSGLWAILQKKRTWHFSTSAQYHLKRSARYDFVSLLAKLLENGFSYQESLSFLQKIWPEPHQFIEPLQTMLKNGHPLYEGFKTLGFSAQQVAQLYFAERHGDFVGTLHHVAKQMRDSEKQRRKFYQVMTYPLILFIFLIGMFGFMRGVLLPQLQTSIENPRDNLGVKVITYAPTFLIGMLLGGLVIFLLCRYILRNKTASQKMNLYSRLPLLGTWLTDYVTSFFAYEWGKLLVLGLPLRDVFSLMKAEGSTPLMKEMGTTLSQSLESGESLSEPFQSWHFVLPGFKLILLEGEVTGKLGKELQIYGRRVWQQLMRKIEKGIQWVQPLVFIIVALLIISIYAAILLPMYDAIGGME
ncbi:MAG: competence type IV pilus assembly protein ComGB [Vagococcus sp.]|nr:competence type IV pilus assembly protein ComGB [Vagococcus sp.]